jgi:hypothetical protein
LSPTRRRRENEVPDRDVPTQRNVDEDEAKKIEKEGTDTLERQRPVSEEEAEKIEEESKK